MLDFAIKVLTARAGQTHLFAVGQAGYILKSRSGQLLAIDLYLSDCVERIEGHKGYKRLLPQILSPSDLIFDAVVCTHPHFDHFDMDAVPEMVSRGARLFCSADCEKLIRRLQMEYYKDSITYVKPRESYDAGDFHISFVNCDHGTSAPDAVGVVVKVDGKSIYEVGDSSLRLDRAGEIHWPLDILIPPINGMYGNMDSEEAIKLAENLRPALTIPCHYGMFASHGGDLKKFYDGMTEKKLPFLLMQQGEQYTF